MAAASALTDIMLTTLDLSNDQVALSNDDHDNANSHGDDAVDGVACVRGSEGCVQS